MSHTKAINEQPQRNELDSTAGKNSAYSSPKLTMFGSVSELTLGGAGSNVEGPAMVDPTQRP